MQHSDSEPHNGCAKGRRFSIVKLIPIAVLLVGGVLFFVFDLDRYATPDALKQNREALLRWVEATGMLGSLIYIAVYAIATAFSIPGGALLTIAGGFLFGPVLASICVVIGATIGATAVFLAARYAFADVLRGKAAPWLKKMEAGFRENAMSYMLVLRLVPIFPFWLVNLVPAFLGVPVRIYVIGTAIGIIPGVIVYTLVGDGLGALFEAGEDLDLRIIFQPRILAPILGLAVLAFMPIICKRWKAGRK